MYVVGSQWIPFVSIQSHNHLGQETYGSISETDVKIFKIEN